MRPILDEFDDCPRRLGIAPTDQSRHEALVPSILIGDANAAERQSLRATFSEAGFRVAEGVGLTECLSHLGTSVPTLILLAEEISPAPAHGLSYVVRRATRAPLILVGEGDDDVEVRALNAGADCYLRRPLDFTIALARIRALLRISRSSIVSRAGNTPWSVGAPPVQFDRSLLAPQTTCVSRLATMGQGLFWRLRSRLAGPRYDLARRIRRREVEPDRSVELAPDDQVQSLETSSGTKRGRS